MSPAGPPPTTTTSQSVACLAVAAIARQYLRPLDSHVPSTLIQNESRIKRRSSHNDCRRT